MSGSSGRLLGLQALLIQIGAESIEVRWRSPVLADLDVHRVESSERWELEYVDDSLCPNGPDKKVIEVYRFDEGTGKVQRLLRYHEP